jgi:hypothetical protein
MRYLWSILALGVLALVAAWAIPVSRLNHTCVLCRLGRVDATCLGLTRSNYYENECSRWYAAHVEPSHEHVWERGTCCYESNLLGMPLSVGCRPGHYPIRKLDPDTQLRVYQHFGDPLEAKKLFAGLTDEKTHDDRIDEFDYEDRGHLTVRALKEWEAAGFPGTWGEYWGRFYAKHVAEHEEYLAWMKADSGLNFWDWQKTRRAGRPSAEAPRTEDGPTSVALPR